MSHISRILTYPVKSLPMLAREQATLIADGALAGDRAYAVFEAGVSPGEASVAGGGGYISDPRLKPWACQWTPVQPTNTGRMSLQ